MRREGGVCAEDVVIVAAGLLDGTGDSDAAACGIGLPIRSSNGGRFPTSIRNGDTLGLAGKAEGWLDGALLCASSAGVGDAERPSPP